MQGVKKFEIKKKITAERVKKLDIILIKLQDHITMAENKRYKNPSSMIIVKRKLSSNCDLSVSRQTLILNEEHNNIAFVFFFDFFLGKPADGQAIGNVLKDIHVGKKSVRLEYHAHISV